MTVRFVQSRQIKLLQLSTFPMKPLSVLITAIVLTSGSIGCFTQSAQAQSMLQEQGSLQSTEQAHLFSGEAGQTVTISLSSSEFDTYIVLLDPSGKEIAANDDAGRSPNSLIVFTLPQSGQYKVLARSYDGRSGSYTVSVKPATPFDQAYAKGVQFFSEGRLEEAAAALSEAIQIEPNQPAPYLDRAEVSLAQRNVPSALSDYQQAADLYEQAGDSKAANDIRQHLTVLQAQPTP